MNLKKKIALRICLNDDSIHYEEALTKVNLQTLEQRRIELCLNLAKSCTKNPHKKFMFPLNDNPLSIKIRNREKYHVQHANKARLQNSAIPYMQNLLNSYST